MRLIVAALLLLTSCSGGITGGKITGKYSRRDIWMYYYLQLENNGDKGIVEVTEGAWEQAHEGMIWPFEIKNNATTSNDQNGK